MPKDICIKTGTAEEMGRFSISMELLSTDGIKCDILMFKRNIFFLLERPNLFAICNNTFSKWWEGWRMSYRRELSSTPLLVRGSETGGDIWSISIELLSTDGIKCDILRFKRNNIQFRGGSLLVFYVQLNLYHQPWCFRGQLCRDSW
jgi:hypothetical protein